MITVTVVDALPANTATPMTVLGFRQFLVQPNPDGTFFDPSDANGRFVATYIGSPMPVKQGYVDDRFGQSCPAPVSFGSGEGGTAPMKRGRSGSVTIELAMWLPVIFLLLAGIIQFGKITYIYYSLQKTVTAIASYLAVQNGVNFCPDAGDATIAAAIEFGITGTTDGSGPVGIVGLTPDMFSVTTQCIDPVTLTLGDCASSGCGTPVGAQRPDFLTVSMPNGYIIQPRIPYILLDPIPLKPQAVMAIRRRVVRRRRSGQSSVEFALLYSAAILPLTFMIVFVSEALWIWHSVVDFTRDGANYAATHCWMGDGTTSPTT